MIGYHQPACQTGGFMRTFVRALIGSIRFAGAVSAAQKPEEGGIPSSGKQETALCAALIVAAIAVVPIGLAQTPDVGGRAPSAKAEALVIEGCVSGPLLRELRVQKSHMPTEKPETAVVYRLDGDKKMLQLIKKEHQDQLLKVAGEITSNNTAVTRSKTMGKLTVYAADGRPEQTPKGKQESYPTLRVTSFEVVRLTCEQ